MFLPNSVFVSLLNEWIILDNIFVGWADPCPPLSYIIIIACIWLGIITYLSTFTPLL